jgi:hypothetical protein
LEQRRPGLLLFLLLDWGLLNRLRRERGDHRFIRWSDRQKGRGGFVSEKNGPFQLREMA